MSIGTCDICSAKGVSISHAVVHGIETYACALCLDNDDVDDLRSEVERLLPKAKTAEQQAHIRALQERIVNLSR